MQRALAVVMAFAGCTLAGMRCAARLKRRRDALYELVNAVTGLEQRLVHTNRPLAELLMGSGGRETGRMLDAMAARIAAGETPACAWEQLRGEGGILPELTERDETTLTVFFSALGASDRHAQLQHLASTRTTLTMLSDEAARVYAGKGRVYRSMGLLLGAGVGILML